MKNKHGVTMRRRVNRSGSISWQVDFGIVDGQRVIKSFRDKHSALQANMLGIVRRGASLEEIEAERLRLKNKVAEHELKIAELNREVARLRSYKMKDGVPMEITSRLTPSSHVFELPHASSGVYFLCLGLEIQYIGMSHDVPMRVARHRQRGVLKYDRVLVIPYAPAECFEMESWWIKEIQPPCNGEAPIQFQTAHCRP